MVKLTYCIWIAGIVFWIVHQVAPLISGPSGQKSTRELYIKVTTLLLEPYVMVKLDDTKTSSSRSGYDVNAPKVTYEGYIVDLLDQLASLLGFDYRIQIVPDGQYGFRRLDGTWNGMIGQLLRKEVDIAAAPMFVTEQRQQVVDFTEPFLEVKATILIKRPPLGRRYVTITSAADLIGQSEYEIGTRESGMVARAFRKTNHTVYRRLWKRLRRKYRSSFTSSNEEGISRVRSGRYAFILPSTIAEYIARKEPCDLVTVDRFLLDAHFALALPKGSGLVGQLNRALYLLEDDGFLERLYEKWWVKKNDCNGVQYSKMYSLSSSAARAGSTPLVVLVVVTYFRWRMTRHVTWP